MIVHLNGQLVPAAQARVSAFDRGFLFGDGIYEGLRAFAGRVVRTDLHVRRMDNGLRTAHIPWDAARLDPLTRDLLDANKLRDAFIYWQVTRGEPAPGQPVRARVLTGPVRPTVFGYCVPAPPLSDYEPDRVPCKTAITTPDNRWLRGAVKSISLLGSVLGAIDSTDAGSDDAIFVRETGGRPLVCEGTSANLVAAVAKGSGTELVTPRLDTVPILAGVTRDILLAGRAGLVERDLTQGELKTAHEVMLIGTLTMVTSVVKLDGRPVGDGHAGPEAKRLLRSLIAAIREA